MGKKDDHRQYHSDPIRVQHTQRIMRSTGFLPKRKNSRLEEKLQSAQKSAAVWKQRYEKIYDKYQELKKEVQPYLDAVKSHPKRCGLFLMPL